MTTRRDFLTVSLVATGAALAPRLAGAAGKATTKSLTTVRESSFIKAFDDYFVKTLAPEYEKLTGIKVGYEAVSVGGMLTRLTTMAETKSGPEIVHTGINWPHLFDQSLVDVSDLAGEVCSEHHGIPRHRQLGAQQSGIQIRCADSARARQQQPNWKRPARLQLSRSAESGE